MSLFSSDGINFPEASSFLSISSLHQRNRDRHDHHDGTATVEHCHLWAVQLTVEGAKMVLNIRKEISRCMRRQRGSRDAHKDE